VLAQATFRLEPVLTFWLQYDSGTQKNGSGLSVLIFGIALLVFSAIVYTRHSKPKLMIAHPSCSLFAGCGFTSLGSSELLVEHVSSGLSRGLALAGGLMVLASVTSAVAGHFGYVPRFLRTLYERRQKCRENDDAD
jgi:hypothetical protein